MLKLIGAVLLVLAGTLAGYAESRRLSLRVRKLELFLRFLEAAQTEIRFSGMPVERILGQHPMGLAFLTECSEKCAAGENFTAAWSESVGGRAAGEGFLPADRELLLGFGRGFGASDTDGQLSHCSLYSTLVQSNLDTAREERGRKAKLYQMLGVFAGLAVSLILY